MALYREWKTCFDWLEGPATDGMDDDEFDRACDVRRAIEDRMFALPSRTPPDVLAKLAAYSFDGDLLPDDGGQWSSVIVDEAVAMVKGGAA